MLQTIEVKIDHGGRIYPLEELSPVGRAYLTLLPPLQSPSSFDELQSGSVSQALKLLATERYAKRPEADMDEVQQRIHALRNECGDQ